MGDIGSTFLGAVFIGLIIQSSSWHELLSLFLLVSPLFLDASICLIRRFFSGKPVFSAHRSHLFQRLQRSGWPHSKVTLLYVFATLLQSLSLFLGGFPLSLYTSLLIFLLGAYLDYRFAVPFASIPQENTPYRPGS